MKFSATIVTSLLLLAVGFGQEVTQQENFPGISVPPPPSIGQPEPSEVQVPSEPENPQDETPAGIPVPGSPVEDQQQIVEAEGEGGQVDRPKRFFWPVFNNHHYHHYSGYGHRHYHRRSFCRHYHYQCYYRPYYHCDNTCTDWGYYNY